MKSKSKVIFSLSDICYFSGVLITFTIQFYFYVIPNPRHILAAQRTLVSKNSIAKPSLSYAGNERQRLCDHEDIES